MENTNLLQALSLQTPNIGTMRETFFCNQLGYKHQVEYNKRGDYLIDHKQVFEIGGKAKDGKQVANMDNAFIASELPSMLLISSDVQENIMAPARVIPINACKILLFFIMFLYNWMS